MPRANIPPPTVFLQVMGTRRYTINSLSIDLSDASEGSVRRGLELAASLAGAGVPSTFFLSPEVFDHHGVIRQIGDLGHELGLYVHRDSMTSVPRRSVEWLRQLRSGAEQVTGRRIAGCRIAPLRKSSAFSRDLHDAMLMAGFEYSSSVLSSGGLAPGIKHGIRRATPVGTRGGRIWEIPPSAWRPLGVGVLRFSALSGESRTTPPLWILSRAINNSNRHGEPALVSLRVHDLVDADGSLRRSASLLLQSTRLDTISSVWSSRLGSSKPHTSLDVPPRSRGPLIGSDFASGN